MHLAPNGLTLLNEREDTADLGGLFFRYLPGHRDDSRLSGMMDVLHSVWPGQPHLHNFRLGNI